MKTIIITGPSGSGKTFLSNRLSKIFSNTIVIKTDSYYRGNGFIRFLSIFKFDIYDRLFSIKKYEIKSTIESIYNKDVLITFTHYNFKNKHSSKSSETINYNIKNQFILIEGIFSHRLDLNYKKTINIVCIEEKQKCFKRRIVRDQLKRGRKSSEIKKKFNKSWYLFYQNIKNFLKNHEVIYYNPSSKDSYEKLIAYLNQINK
tara:strand:+ start:812 stop:1420 length:609 start_codon:yes stop_codon:yes gene_type:complete